MEFYPEGMNAELDRQFTTPEALRRAMMQGSILESRVLLVTGNIIFMWTWVPCEGSFPGRRAP
mgnify:CR=1 FL=1